MGALLGALFFFPAGSFAKDWKDLQWLRLLHYNKTFTGGYLSEADGNSFFLHPEGKSSPEQELEAFLTQLKRTPAESDNDVRCLFPARYRWARKNLELPSGNEPVCPKLDAFRKRVSGKSIFVVFSSYYLNNPGSSFGHTFIRIGKGETSSELLDTGINYGMMSEGAGPVLYTVGGLAGWFPGTFNAIPYYYKVREYNDYESRDLWSYRLNFTQEEVDMAVDHIWELGPTYFDYYFLTENCSQMMLAILEVARPSIDLKKHLPYLYTIPSDTLKTLDKEKLIESVSYRPSASSLFYHQMKLMDEARRKKITTFQENTELDVEGLPEQEKAFVLDTAISWIDYKYAKEILKQEEKAQAIKRPLLVKRSKVPVRSPELDFSHMLKEAPHGGHGSQRLVLGGGQFDGKNFADLSWRFAFHDFLDYDLAYPPRTRLEVVKFDLQSDGRKVYLQDLSFLDIMTLGTPSWKIKMGHWQTRFEKNWLSTEGVRGGYGYSYQAKHWAPYVLGHFETSYISEELHKAKLGYGADLGFILDFSRNFKFNSVLELRAHPWNEGLWMNEARLSDKSYGIGLYNRSWLKDGDQEVGAKLLFYF